MTTPIQPERYDPKQAFNDPAAAITVTPAAEKHLQAQIEKQAGAIGIRFGIKAAGCTGYKYTLAIVNEKMPEDYCFPINNTTASVFVDQASMPFVKGTVIDYVFKGLNQQFAYHNPNVKDACGCGESFNIIDLDEDEE